MPRRQTTLSKLPLSERLLILNALELSPDSTRLNGPMLGLFIGGAGAPLDVSTVYLRVREGKLPPPDATLGAKQTAWLLSTARKVRAEMAERISANKTRPAERAEHGKSLNAASVKSLRQRQAKAGKELG